MKKILNRQIEFQKNFFKPGKLSTEQRKFWTKEFVLATHQELTEVMQSIDWKKYHTYNREYTKEETQEEIIDCFKFIMNLMIIFLFCLLRERSTDFLQVFYEILFRLLSSLLAYIILRPP